MLIGTAFGSGSDGRWRSTMTVNIKLWVYIASLQALVEEASKLQDPKDISE